MESLLVLRYPKTDLEEISRLVRQNDSFVALMTGDIYGIHQYLLPSRLRNFTAVLDRNVYTRVTALVRGNIIKPHAIGDHRWAAAIMAFCHIAEIHFQYGSSLQEYANHKGGVAAISEFECFRRADNCDPKAVIDFALGRTEALDLRSVKNLGPSESTPAAEEFEAPIYEFRLNYILALKIALLSLGNMTPEKAMLQFINWMDTDFILTAPAFQFANLLFSPARIKGMLKTKSLQDIRNVAWDLALIQHWRRCALEGRETNEPVLLVSRDKVVKFISKRLEASDEEEFRSHVIDVWNPKRSKGKPSWKGTFNCTNASTYKMGGVVVARILN